MYGLYPQVAMGLYMGLYHGHANNTAAIRFAPARRQCSQLKKKKSGKIPSYLLDRDSESHSHTIFHITQVLFTAKLDASRRELAKDFWKVCTFIVE